MEKQKLGTVIYYPKNKPKEKIIFPAQHLNFDYIVILNLIKNYQQFNKSPTFSHFIHNQIQNLQIKISTIQSNNPNNIHKNLIIQLQKEIEKFKKYFPSYF